MKPISNLQLKILNIFISFKTIRSKLNIFSVDPNDDRKAAVTIKIKFKYFFNITQ